MKGKNTRKERNTEKQCEEQPSEHLAGVGGEGGGVVREVVLQKLGQRLRGGVFNIGPRQISAQKKRFSDLQIKPSLVAVYSLTGTAYYGT